MMWSKEMGYPDWLVPELNKAIDSNISISYFRASVGIPYKTFHRWIKEHEDLREVVRNYNDRKRRTYSFQGLEARRVNGYAP